MPKTQGIVGTNSPLVLIGTVHLPNGTSGIVYVGQHVLACTAVIESEIRPLSSRDGEPAATWHVGIWDTRDLMRKATVLDYVGSGAPTMADAYMVEFGIVEWLHNNR